MEKLVGIAALFAIAVAGSSFSDFPISRDAASQTARITLPPLNTQSMDGICYFSAPDGFSQTPISVVANSREQPASTCNAQSCSQCTSCMVMSSGGVNIDLKSASRLHPDIRARCAKITHPGREPIGWHFMASPRTGIYVRWSLSPGAWMCRISYENKPHFDVYEDLDKHRVPVVWTDDNAYFFVAEFEAESYVKARWRDAGTSLTQDEKKYYIRCWKLEQIVNAQEHHTPQQRGQPQDDTCDTVLAYRPVQQPDQLQDEHARYLAQELESSTRARVYDNQPPHCMPLEVPMSAARLKTFVFDTMLQKFQSAAARRTRPCAGDLIGLLRLTSTALSRLPNVVHMPTRDHGHIIAIGDLHAQWKDFHYIATNNAPPGPDNRYVFIGDWVDRGNDGVLIITMLCLYFHYGQMIGSGSNPVVLLRGNHESWSTHQQYGFSGGPDGPSELQNAYGDLAQLISAEFTEFFKFLPVAARYDKMFFVHGGVPRQNPHLKVYHQQDAVSIEKINQQNRFTGDLKLNTIIYDMLWADPFTPSETLQQCTKDFAPGGRGPDSIMFCEGATLKFLRKNGLDLIVRAHQLKDGYEFSQNGKVLTVFSVSKYSPCSDNHGGIIRFELPAANPQPIKFMANPVVVI